MPMSPRLLRPRSSGVHPEAASWRTRVVANGGSVSATTMQAVDRFCRSIDANGLRSLLWRVNPMAGDNLSAALVPLYQANSAGGAVQGNATDTNTNFVSGDYTATSGLLGNGSNKSLNTGLPVNFNTGRHLGCFLHSLSANTFRAYMGAAFDSAGTNNLLLSCDSPVTTFRLGNGGPAAQAGGVTGGTNAAGDFVMGTSNGLGILANGGLCGLFSNGAATGGSSLTAYSGADTVTPISIFCRRLNDGTNQLFYSGRIGGYTIGAFMTSAQAATYYTVWDTLLRSLGRK